MFPGGRFWFESVRCLHKLNVVRHRILNSVGPKWNLRQRFITKDCYRERLLDCHKMAANETHDMKQLSTTVTTTATGVGRTSPGLAQTVPATEDGCVGLESEPRDVALAVEGGTPAPQQKVSRRAMKRMMRNKQRAAAKEGRTVKRRRKEDAGELELNFTESSLKEAEYYFEHGLRKVYPYYFTFSTYAKGRWVGENILDIFGKEFRAYDRETYRIAINSGTVTVNSRQVDTSYVFKESDFIENTVHRHELAVTGAQIKIVKETDTVLVLDKPSSIPVHPCGRYRYNSMTYILAKDYGYRNLRSIYRLDRLTSGLLIFTKTDTQAQMMHDHIKNRKVEKSYVAMVTGRFPSEPKECSEPIDNLSQKIGLFKVGKDGKEACTSFELLHTNGENSVVLCKPHTGRTHQIRVHLQYLGYPIVNDPLYNTDVWGPNRGKGGNYGKDEEQLVEDLIKHHNAERFNDEVSSIPQTDAVQKMAAAVTTDVSVENAQCEESTSGQNIANPDPSPSETLIAPSGGKYSNDGDCSNLLSDSSAVEIMRTDTSEDSTSQNQQAGGTIQAGFDPSKMTVDPVCMECRKRYKDPSPNELVMFLHALSYKGPGWEFSTDMPDWAQQGCHQPKKQS